MNAYGSIEVDKHINKRNNKATEITQFSPTSPASVHERVPAEGRGANPDLVWPQVHRQRRVWRRQEVPGGGWRVTHHLQRL